MKSYMIALLLLASSASMKANNLQISNLAVNSSGATTTVTFDIAWENSWRGGPASNYDAAWVFLKYKGNDGVWHHLDLTGTNNNAGNGTGLTLEVPSDKKGVFVYRSTSGFGALATTGVTLGVQQKAGTFDVKVFGLEMVYIPQGAFFVGGPGTASFYTGNIVGSLYSMNSSVVPTMGTSGQSLNYNFGTNNGIINGKFPTGYNAYYIMKYELTQGGFRDFLNTSDKFTNFYLERTDLNSATPATGSLIFAGNAALDRMKLRYTGDPNNPIGCNSLASGSFNEADDGEWVACGSLLWSDQAAYLDWAALRPMTEFEYEKACRGPEQPISGGTAGGFQNNVPVAISVLNLDADNETASFTNPSNDAISNVTEASISFPLRVGFAATNSSNRFQAGASYYGVMELTGNLMESVVSVLTDAGRSFEGTLGDGELGLSVTANVNSWPGIQASESTANSAGVVNKFVHSGIAPAGGSYKVTQVASFVQFRQSPAAYHGTSRANVQGYGCRGVRQQL